MLLASIDFTGRDGIQQTAATTGRLVGATDDEIEAAVMAVRAALDHPILRNAATKKREALRRETPVLMRLEDGSLAEGVVDLARTEHSRDSAWNFGSSPPLNVARPSGDQLCHLRHDHPCHLRHSRPFLVPHCS